MLSYIGSERVPVQEAGMLFVPHWVVNEDLQSDQINSHLRQLKVVHIHTAVC
jgi:hypothetical protein